MVDPDNQGNRTVSSSGSCLEKTLEPRVIRLVARPPIHTASLAKWDPSNQRDDIYLYVDDDADETTNRTTSRENFRYKLTILDSSSIKTASSFAYATAVFLIPAGRESEYLFQAGLRAIQSSAGAARLIAVTFGRGQVYANQQATVQAELMTVVQIVAAPVATAIEAFLQQQQRSSSTTSSNSQNTSAKSGTMHSATIPFMALGGIGERNVLNQGESAVSGRYLVEECSVGAASGNTHHQQQQYVRRLYFLDGNPFVIQSEVALLMRPPPSSILPIRDTNDDDTAKSDILMVDKSVTAFHYHKCVTAGILSLLPDSSSDSKPTVLLIGLGGGGLVNLWHYIQHSPALPNAWDVTAVELDPCMVEIASKYFSVDCEQILIMIGDGLAIHCTNNDNNGDSSTLQTEIEAKDTNNNIGTDDNAPLGFEAASLDVIVLDVDSKDSGSGMSCPPAGFVEVEYLGKLSSLLRQDTGVLAINVSARDPSLFAATCQTVLSVFPSVYLSKKGYGSVKKDTDVDNEGMYDSDVDETDLNVVVFATFRQSLPSYQKMADNLERRMREIHLVKDESKGVDEIVLSDLCSCLEDFTTCNIEDETNSNPGETKSQRKKTGNSKRRNTKRGSHKKR